MSTLEDKTSSKYFLRYRKSAPSSSFLTRTETSGYLIIVTRKGLYNLGLSSHLNLTKINRQCPLSACFPHSFFNTCDRRLSSLPCGSSEGNVIQSTHFKPLLIKELTLSTVLIFLIVLSKKLSCDTCTFWATMQIIQFV